MKDYGILAIGAPDRFEQSIDEVSSTFGIDIKLRCTTRVAAHEIIREQNLGRMPKGIHCGFLLKDRASKRRRQTKDLPLLAVVVDRGQMLLQGLSLQF